MKKSKIKFKTVPPRSERKSEAPEKGVRKIKSPAKSVPPKSVDEYLARVPEAASSTLNKMRATIRAAVPSEATEVISYGIPAFRYKQILVWYAAFSDHCSLFPKAAIIEEFKDELRDYTTSKGTIHFPLDKPLPTDLIRRMVKARVKQVEE